jgi:ATP-dependent DNA helicase PIF1
MTQKEALEILKTGANVFLTGEPGSGKTYTINQYVEYLREHGIEPAITASTGIAATHIGGYTIHSWSGIGIKKNLSKYDYDFITTKEHVVKRIEKTKVLIFDEVSMLDASTLESVDYVCRLIKRNEFPFGGLQVVLVGDFFQLPPVSRNEIGPASRELQRGEDRSKERREDTQEIIFDDFEPRANRSNFCFHSRTWTQLKPLICYLSEQHRQEDDKFLSILASIRRNEFGEEHFSHIQSRMGLGLPKAGIPKLFSHNEDVDRINGQELGKIFGDMKVYKMESRGSKPLVESIKRGCLSPEKLELKIGAKVMFTKNNSNEGFVNGTLGEVVDFDEVSSMPIVRTMNGRQIEVEQMEWVIEENNKIKASITQLPLRLAWAITIHKSQGMSMDAAVMDLSQVFEYGQGYVALSRVRKLAGIYLLGVNEKCFQVHPEVLEQDEKFRLLSEEAAEAFENMNAGELTEMHHNFIRASGGTMEKPKKSGGFDKIREKHPKAFMRWTEEEEAVLMEKFQQTNNLQDLAKQMGRKAGGIRSRLIKLGLIEEDESF